MNILLNKLPEAVQIDGITYDIHTDYRIGIQFESILMNTSIPYIEKMKQVLQLYYPVIPNNLTQAFEQLLWFYSCGSSKADTTNEKSGSSNEQMFDYEQDQYMIYTAFFTYYHIDLNSIEQLHWWKFKQLFNELPDDAKLKKVMLYRCMHIDPNMSKEQKQFYADMKSIYKLKNEQKEKQKANNFASILASGMHIADD